MEVSHTKSILVSIIVPIFNAEKYLARMVQSVKQQSFTNWELILVDDGSTDSSLAIAKSFESEKVKVISQKNSGACIARNKGLKLAQGAFIKFLDADDIIDKDCLTKQYAQIQSLSKYQIPFGDYDYIDINDKTFKTIQFEFNDILKQDQVYFFYTYWQVLITCPLHRKELLLQIGGFDEKLKRGQESDLHLRLALRGVEFIYIPCVTFHYREHNSPTKLTNRSNKGTINMEEYWEYRFKKCESLLTEKYGHLPTKYVVSFVNYWFNRARKSFFLKQKDEGIKCMDYVSSHFSPLPHFFTIYNLLGKLIGYVNLEAIFQVRLKVLKK